MRRTSSGLITLLLAVALTACTSPAAAPVPAPATGQAPASPPQLTPVPAVTCTPGTSAMVLPSAPYGSGITLPPVPAGATAEKPAFGYLSVTQLFRHEGGGGIVGNVYLRQGGIATVDAGEFTLEGRLQPAPAEDWYKTHLQVTGVQPSEQSYMPAGGGWFHLRIPAGKTGDSFQLTLKDVLRPDGSQGDLTVDFCRQTPPEATVAEQAEDGFKVRLTFSRDMLRETVERSLKGPHDKEGGSQGDWITGLTWVDNRTVEMTASEPRPVMRLNLSGAQDTFGLFVPQSPPNVYTGAPPQVVAVDLASGQETPLATLPPEPDGATVSPDGKWLRVTSMQVRGGASAPEWQHRLVDLTTGTATAIKPEDLYGTWTTAGLFVGAIREGENGLTVTRSSPKGDPAVTRITDLPTWYSVAPSPDGKWLAVEVLSENPHGPSASGLLIISPNGETRNHLQGEFSLYRPGKDGIMFYGPTWSPDSTRLALTEKREGGAALIIADLKAGALRTLAENLPGVQASFDPIVWSPDGSRILVGPLLVDAATGQVVQRLEGIVGRPHWSPDGQQLLFQASPWEPVAAFHLADGKKTDLGTGLLLGWRPDGKALIIRWPGAAHRTAWWSL